MKSVITTRTPPVFVERAIRTVKEWLLLRMNALNNKNWYRLVQDVVTKYNNRKQTTIGMTPLEALLEENVKKVKENITAKSSTYPSLPRPRNWGHCADHSEAWKHSEFKAGFVGWSKTKHQVESIEYENGSRAYKVSQRVKPLLRHELLKIEGAESAPQRSSEGRQEPAALIQRKRAAQASD